MYPISLNAVVSPRTRCSTTTALDINDTLTHLYSAETHISNNVISPPLADIPSWSWSIRRHIKQDYLDASPQEYRVCSSILVSRLQVWEYCILYLEIWHINAHLGFQYCLEEMLLRWMMLLLFIRREIYLTGINIIVLILFLIFLILFLILFLSFLFF